MAPDERKATTAAYLGTYAVLLVLTALTSGVAYVDLGAANTAVALGVAAAKAGLVAVVFMHARAAGRMGAVFALLGVFWVAVLIGLTLGETAVRAG